MILLLITACDNDSSEKTKPAAVNGTIDLSKWDFVRDGAIRLDGQWEFYWDRLLEPSDFLKEEHQKKCGFITVPGLWKGLQLNGLSLPGNGRATYRLRIISGPDKKLSLTIHRVFSVYRLWINGILADKKGTVNGLPKSREDYIFIHNKKTTSFLLNEDMNEIILQVVNYDYESGGIDRPLRLDDGEITSLREFRRYTADMIVVGLLLFAFIYNILFYFTRKTDAAPLYIGFACLAWSINTFNIQSPILSGSLSYPQNPFLINYITVILGTALCMLIMRSLFPDDFLKHMIRFIQFLTIATIVPVLFTGFRTAEQIMKAYFILVIMFSLYIIYVFVKAIINRRDGAVLFSIGFLSLVAGGINNILYAMWIIDTGNAIPYSMVILCLTATMVVSRRFAGAMSTVENLSKDLEQKNIELQKMDRLKDEFLANTSHELRTPLHGMIGLSESMIEGTAGDLPPKAIENLSLIATSGYRLSNMVNDLLDMAKIQDKGLNLTLRPVNMYTLSEMVVRLSLPLVGEKPLEIINSIRPDIPAAHADEDRIRQVLYNLIGNAVKFTNNGTIELSARVIHPADVDSGSRNGNKVEVSVSDTGIGVPDDYKEKIFEVYQQVDGSDTRSYGGTGLGLAIAKQIVELHNGSIKVESGRSGGSVFSFTLPVSHDPLPETAEEIIIENMEDALTADDTPGRQRLIAGINGAFENNPVLLVVDDDPVNIRVLQNYFESKKCVVKTVPDGITALDIIEKDDSIDLVLLDIMMPVMSGYEVCRRIRLTRKPEELPVIMLTAKNMMKDIDAAFEAGANDYIVKPFRISELLARVSTMLKLRNVRKTAAEGITIRCKSKTYSLKYSDIIYITSHLKNIVIHTTERDIEVPVQTKEIIDRLPPDMFVRIHKSHIINIKYFNSLSHVLSGRYRVRLRDDDETELPVGPAFLEPLRKKI